MDLGLTEEDRKCHGTGRTKQIDTDKTPQANDRHEF